MSLTFAPAVRDRVGLLISISGGTGSGKSFSALKVARGLATKPGEDLTDPATLAKIDARIAAIDTEAGRLKHYAPAPGQLPGPAAFGFMHGDMKAPFSPEAYSAGIAEIDRLGFEVAIVDSGSHLWAGDGGVCEMQEEALDAMVDRARAGHERDGRNYPFDEDRARERLSMSAWKEPKMEHKKFVSRLLQSRCHIILCLRAEEKMLMETVEEQGANGKKYKKTVITPAKDRPINERWQPIAEKKLAFEFGTSLLLTTERPGFPIWLKVEEQHQSAVPTDRPLSELTGQRLAEWARGGASKSETIDDESVAKAALLQHLKAEGAAKAQLGIASLKAWFTALPNASKHLVKPLMDELKLAAEKVAQ